MAAIIQAFQSNEPVASLILRIRNEGIGFEPSSEVVQRLGKAGVPHEVIVAILDAPINMSADPDDLYRRGHYDQAIEVLKGITAKNPHDYKSLYKLVLLDLKQNRSLDAAAEFKALKRLQDDPEVQRLVREIEELVPELDIDPEAEQKLRDELRKALEELRTADAYSAVDRLHMGARSKEILRAYLAVFQANFPSALMHAAAVGAGNTEVERQASLSLRTEIERSFRQYDALVRDVDRFLYSQYAVGSCTPVTARNNVSASDFSLQNYSQLVLEGNNNFPLSSLMQDLRFHDVLVSTTNYSRVAKVGDEVLRSKGSLRIPFYSRDAIYWVVVDEDNRRLYTELNSRFPRNEFGSNDLRLLEPFNLGFDEIREVKQRILAEQALLGISKDSYVLHLDPRGEAPNYAFMNLVHCLYGENTERAVAKNLGEFLFHAIGNTEVKTTLVDPEKTTRDWAMTGARPIAGAAIVIAVATTAIVIAKGTPKTSDPNSQPSTSDTLNQNAGLIQTSMDVLSARAAELARRSSILDDYEDSKSMFDKLQIKGFALIDRPVSALTIGRVEILLGIRR